MPLHFTKMQALGNDFMIVDCINQSFRPLPALVCQLADRHFGIGFDQLLLVESSPAPRIDFFYRIFNADGSESAQCGNGARCFARFVFEQGLTTKNLLTIATLNGILQLSLQEDGQVKVNMGVPILAPKHIPFIAPEQALIYKLQVADQSINVNVVSMGNPHCIIQTPLISQAPVASVGPLIAKHQRFPEGTNVEFMEIIDRSHIQLRVYERGVGETLACGSGAAAAVASGHLRGLLDNKVEVTLPGGNLSVEWEGMNKPLWLTGAAQRVFDGTV